MTDQGKKKRGVAKSPPESLYHRRYFSLPPDVIKLLDSQPSGQRSRVVADAIRAFLGDKRADTSAEKTSPRQDAEK